MKHTEESKRRIGEASRFRRSASIAIAARWKNKITICSVAGCGQVHYGKSFCLMHYQRWKKHGDPGQASKIRKENPGGIISAYGYRFFNRTAEHILIAEKAIGKKLPLKAIVHHANENKLDNSPSNLVICPDRNYHNLMHARMRALEECGNANWLKCPFCGKYDDPKNLYVYPNKRAAKHQSCFRSYRQRRQRAD